MHFHTISKLNSWFPYLEGYYKYLNCIHMCVVFATHSFVL